MLVAVPVVAPPVLQMPCSIWTGWVLLGAKPVKLGVRVIDLLLELYVIRMSPLGVCCIVACAVTEAVPVDDAVPVAPGVASGSVSEALALLLNAIKTVIRMSVQSVMLVKMK